MHRIVVTQGLVLGKLGAGESNTLVSVFTEELGLIRVAARSARLEVSKLRFGLEALTLARYSLVRGRHEWKLTGVEKISREFCVSPPVRLRKLGKVSRLLQRLIHGEEQVAMLLHIVTQGFKALTEAERSEDAEVLEYVLVLRILAHLGYLAYTPELAPFAQPPPEGGTCTAEVFEEVRLNRTKYIRIINESLSATGL